MSPSTVRGLFSGLVRHFVYTNIAAASVAPPEDASLRPGIEAARRGTPCDRVSDAALVRDAKRGEAPR